MLTIVGMKIIFAQQPPKLEAISADPEIKIGKLQNGLTYYIKKNQKPEKQAEFYIFSYVGAIQEEDSQIGLAHFLEHMAFNGTKNFPNQSLIQYLEKIGVKLGRNLNASTGMEQTLYTMSEVPVTREGIIDSALLILHDWAGFISLNPTEIDKERNIILEELRQRNNAGMRVYEKAMPVIFNHSKYADRNIIGTAENLQKFPYHELEEFYHTWYIPKRQAIFIIGDINVNQIENKIKNLFSDLAVPEQPQAKIIPQIPTNEEPILSIISDPELDISEISVYIRRPPMMKQFNDKLIVASLNMSIRMMTRMLNYRLAELAHQEHAPFTRAFIFNESLTAGCDAIIGKAIVNNGKIEEALKIFYAELEKARRFGFTESEFNRTKTEAYRNIQSKFDTRHNRTSSELVPLYIHHYCRNTPIPSAETEFRTDTALLNSLTITKINQNAKWIISDKNQAILVTIPENILTDTLNEKHLLHIIKKVRDTELNTYTDHIQKKTLVEANLKKSKVKKIQETRFGATEWVLANGIKIIIKPTDFKKDEILFSAISPGGLSLCTDQEYNSGRLVVPLVNISGLGKFSSLELSKQLAGKNIKVSPFINEYKNGFSGYTSPQDLETLLQLIYLYFNFPRFEQQDYNILLERYSSAIANKANNPTTIFQDSIANTLYNHHPRRQILKKNMIKEIDFISMQRIYKRLFGNAHNFTFTFIGNINPEKFRPLAEKYMGSLPVQKKCHTWKEDDAYIVKGKVTNRFQIPMKTPKTHVYCQYTGELDYTSENMFTMAILNQILRIRYTNSIREEKGGAYSITCKGTLSDIPVPRYSLTISFQTDPQKTNELKMIVSEEIHRIAQDGPRPEDISNIREFLIKQRPEELKDNNTWMMYINRYQEKGVDLYNHYDEWVDKLNGEKIKLLATKILKDNNLIQVIMEPTN